MGENSDLVNISAEKNQPKYIFLVVLIYSDLSFFSNKNDMVPTQERAEALRSSNPDTKIVT